jgi:hypothetical protein
MGSQAVLEIQRRKEWTTMYPHDGESLGKDERRKGATGEGRALGLVFHSSLFFIDRCVSFVYMPGLSDTALSSLSFMLVWRTVVVRRAPASLSRVLREGRRRPKGIYSLQSPLVCAGGKNQKHTHTLGTFFVYNTHTQTILITYVVLSQVDISGS